MDEGETDKEEKKKRKKGKKSLRKRSGIARPSIVHRVETNNIAPTSRTQACGTPRTTKENAGGGGNNVRQRGGREEAGRAAAARSAAPQGRVIKAPSPPLTPLDRI